MTEAIVSLFKWVVSVSCFILGVYCLRIVTDTGSIRPFIIVIFSFGTVYLLSRSTYEASKRVFMTGLFVVLGMGLLTHLVLWDIIATYIYPLGFYMSWELATLAVGMPVMFWTYVKGD